MEVGSMMNCIESDNEPGDVYYLRIQRLRGGSLTVSMVYCERCANEFLKCDWIEEGKRVTVAV